MKLVSEKKKRMTLIITIAIVAIVLIAIGVLAFSLIKTLPNNPAAKPTEPPLTMRGISVSNTPDKWEYYVGDEFDPRGTLVQVIMNQQSATHFVGHTELQFSGFDSSVPNENLEITVSYKGYTAKFSVVIKERPTESVEVVSIKLSDDFKSSYTLSEWNKSGPSFSGVKLILVSSDGSETEVRMKYDYCSGINKNLEAPGETQFVIRFRGFETTVTVTITE